jgi:hypothetical protein
MEGGGSVALGGNPERSEAECRAGWMSEEFLLTFGWAAFRSFQK